MGASADVTAAVAAIQAAITNAGVLQGASDATLAPVVNAILAAQATIAADIAAVDAVIGVGVGLSGGTDPAAAVAFLNQQIAATMTQAQLLNIQAYVARMALNIATRL